MITDCFVVGLVGGVENGTKYELRSTLVSEIIR